MSTTALPRPAAEPTPAAAPVPAQIVRGFHPGWFGAVMGTAIVGVAAYQNPGGETGLTHAAHIVGVTFVLAAWTAAVLIAIPYLARLARHRDAAVTDLRHPILGALYGTLAGAIVVLAVATATVGGSLLSAHAVVVIVAVLAAVGGLVAFATGVVFTYMLFTSEGMAADAANGGWFIPPVVSIIIPLTLIPLLPHVGDSAGRLLLLAGYAGLGVGLLLVLLVAAVLFGRLVFHPLPPAALAPSLWIGLGPIGVGSLALLRLAAAGQPYWGSEAAVVQRISTLAAAVLWGFGLWWLATAAILLVRYLRRGHLPFGVGLWAFTFPLGAYTVATLQLARSWPSHPLEWAAAALLLLLAGFWATVTGATLQAIATGKAWQR
jgi:C4-dicarboxylate transporter/malic acid transport protein